MSREEWRRDHFSNFGDGGDYHLDLEGLTPSEVVVSPVVAIAESKGSGGVGPDVRAAQITAHSVFRQSHANIKSAIDKVPAGSPVVQTTLENLAKSCREEGPGRTFFGGLPPRLMSVTFSMGPAVVAKEMVAARNPGMSDLQKAGVATAIETAFGVPLEFLANKHAFLPKDASLALAAPRGIGAAAIFFGARNMCGWLAAFYTRADGEETVEHKMLRGAFSGVVSTPFDTMGNIAMRKGAAMTERSIIGAVSGAFIDTFREIAANPKFFANKVAAGAPFRLVPGMLQALIFSEIGEKEIRKSLDAISDTSSATVAEIQNYAADLFRQTAQQQQDSKEKAAKKSDGTTPSSEAVVAHSKSLKGELNEQQSKGG